MEIQTWILWMVFAAIMIIGEIITAGFFVLWFGIGALAAGLCAAFGLGLGMQLGAFVVVSLLLLLVSRKFAEKISKPQPAGIGADRFIGQKGVVLEEINNLANTGQVRLGKEVWRAESVTDDNIPVNEKIEVVEMSGTHLVVKLLKGE